VTDGHDRTGLRQRVMRKRELTQILCQAAQRLAGDIEHRRRCVGGDDAMPRRSQFLSEQARPAPQLGARLPPSLQLINQRRGGPAVPAGGRFLALFERCDAKVISALELRVVGAPVPDA
jgi:hypothetical protein